MKILNLKINSFGKLKEREIQLNPNINLIYGENESGKSTLLKYIISMFYGISKNKKGKDITDLEKYTPWSCEEFSGKIKYELDNKEIFEIYREFKKKNPKIFNENSEDISKNFKIDKTKGNQFFYEQTNIEEELFLSTIVSEQEAVKLDDKSQNILIQKIANLIGTGEDNISYQKTIKSLDKKLLEEIGTLRSQDRPINIVEKRKREIEEEKAYLAPYILEKYDIQEKKEQYTKELNLLKQKIGMVRLLKTQREKELLEQEKIKINRELEQNYIKEIEERKQALALRKQTKNKEQIAKNKIHPVISLIASILVCIPLFLFLQDKTICYIISAILVGLNIIYFYLYRKNHIRVSNQEKEQYNQKLEIQKEIELLQQKKEEQELEIKKKKQELELKNSIEKDKIKKQFQSKIENVDGLLNNPNIISVLEELERQYQELSLKIHHLELDSENNLPRLDKLAGLEEELGNLKEQEQELELKRESIELAKQVIEIAYNRMKKEVSPKFAQEISSNMEQISSGKYSNIKLNDETGLVVEIENGDYIPAENLSIGTIDQLYLSLRLSAIKQLTEEKLPILLDETFAYFDATRLKNILQYLASAYKDRQIIIFTCTNREKETLDKLNISYHLVKM